ncbi:MAG: FHA domain-containing protein [Verrucomicrobiota bacterium]
MPKLIVSLPDGTDNTHELTEEVITVGREPDNTIQIDTGSVSGYHAQITLVDKHYELKDLNSTNGTRINGQTFTKWQLMNGDKIRFGEIEVAYVSEAQGETRPMPEAATASIKPAETSQRPSNFANASPFKTKKVKKDPTSTAVRAFAGLAVLVFLVSVVCIFLIQAPK